MLPLITSAELIFGDHYFNSHVIFLLTSHHYIDDYSPTILISNIYAMLWSLYDPLLELFHSCCPQCLNRLHLQLFSLHLHHGNIALPIISQTCHLLLALQILHQQHSQISSH